MISVLVEAAAGARTRGRYDEDSLERVGSRELPLPHPYAYGFIPGSHGEDGEAIDCWILDAAGLVEGELAVCEVIGMVEQREGAEREAKILARPPGSPVLPGPADLEALATFVTAAFAPWPEIRVSLGPLLPASAALATLAAASTGRF